MAITFEELKQLDPRDPGRWPLPVRLGVITLVFVVLAAVLLYFVVWGGAKDELATLEQQEQTLREEFHSKHAKAVNLELYKQQLDDIQVTLAEINQHEDRCRRLIAETARPRKPARV